MKLVAAAPDLDRLHRELFAVAPAEGAAFLAVEPSAGRLVLRSFHVFDNSDLDGNGLGHVAISEEAQIRELASIKRRGHAAVEAHTHPGSGSAVSFSAYDEAELPAFARYVRNKLPNRPFAALVLGESGYAGCVWSQAGVRELDLIAVGERGSVPPWLDRLPVTEIGGDVRFDRQIRALGADGQRRLSSLTVAVVGLGGTGSQVIQQLAHLGVRRFVLIEDDRVEATNLSRLAGAAWWDPLLRTSKVAVAKRTIRRLAPWAEVHATGSLRARKSLATLPRVDVIIGCVDNDGARLVLMELAAAHLVPYLDLGVGIEGDREARAIGGRVAFYLPGGPCLACADELDFAEAAEDLESEALRRIRIVRGYANDRRVEPALMPLNTVLVGLAMVELLAYATGIRRVRPFSRYDAFENRVVRQHVELDDDCSVCQPAFAMGDRHGIERYAL